MTTLDQRLTEKEKAIGEIWARSLHPDLYEGVEMSEAASALAKRYERAAQLEDLVRVYLHDDIPLSYTVGSTHIGCTVYDYDRPAALGYVDEDASREQLRLATKALKRLGAAITKDYDNQFLRVKAEFPSGLLVQAVVDRSTVCEKKVVGREWVKPAGGYYKEIVEWECEPVSILADD